MSGGELSWSVTAAFLTLLEQRYALHASPSQATQVEAAVLGLLPKTSYTGPADLLEALSAGLQPELLQALAVSITVGETHFFRVTPQIEALRRVVLPDLIARHAVDRQLRVWSAGCSTGEEPYTLAMLICEQLPSPQLWDIQLVGTDLNAAAIQAARAAVYGDWSFRDAPDHLRERHFTRVANQWQLNSPLRQMVRFAQHNLAHDPCPFAAAGQRPDLITCRNVTIYFGEGATQQLYQRFGEALGPAGWLMLGPSDPAPTPASGFEMVVLGAALIWRQQAVPRRAPVSVEPARRPAPQPDPHARQVRPSPVATRPHPPAEVSAEPSTDASVYLAAGMLQLEKGATSAAIDNLRRAAFLDAASPLIQFSLGRAYREQGATSRSRSAFLHARRLLAGAVDDQLLTGGEVDASELRHAIEVQLAALDRMCL